MERSGNAKSSPRSRAFQIVVGAAAGFGLFFKPHFVLFGVGLGVIDLVRAKSRPQHLLLSTWVAAGASIALYAYLALQPGYLSEMAPFYLQTMGALRGGQAWALTDAVALLAIGAMALLAVRPGKGARWPWLPVSVGAVFCFVALAIFVQQAFGFGYQLLPLKIGTAVAAVFALAWCLSSAALPRRQHPPLVN